MTRITIKEGLDQSKVDVLLGMISSWNVNAEVEDTLANEAEEFVADDDEDLFADVRGIWKDRDITEQELRALAWGTEKRRAQ